jgi:hypothetical protein
VTTYCNRNEIYVFRQLWKPYIELFKVKNSIIRHRRHHPRRRAEPPARADHVHHAPQKMVRPSPALSGQFPKSSGGRPLEYGLITESGCAGGVGGRGTEHMGRLGTSIGILVSGPWRDGQSYWLLVNRKSKSQGANLRLALTPWSTSGQVFED